MLNLIRAYMETSNTPTSLLW